MSAPLTLGREGYPPILPLSNICPVSVIGNIGGQRTESNRSTATRARVAIFADLFPRLHNHALWHGP
jgi:hypothetical protein